MIYSYTQISHYLRCPRSIATAILMVGGRKTLGQPWSSAAALKRL